MSKGRILIVEDNQMNMTLMNDVLNHYNYETICIDNGEEAINIINNETFDLILLDLQLPKVSGFDVLKNIKKDVKNGCKNYIINCRSINIISSCCFNI